MADCRKCAAFSWCMENEECGLFKPKPQTNADRIRSMTDEELARFADNYCTCPPNHNDIGACEKQSPFCIDCWLDWLKQECE